MQVRRASFISVSETSVLLQLILLQAEFPLSGNCDAQRRSEHRQLHCVTTFRGHPSSSRPTNTYASPASPIMRPASSFGPSGVFGSPSSMGFHRLWLPPSHSQVDIVSR